MLASTTGQDRGLPSAAAPPTQISGETIAERRLEFDHILRHALPRFRRMAKHVLRNAEDAEDAVQDAMLSALKNIARFEGRAKMSTWRMTIVTNAIRKRQRYRHRWQMHSLDHNPNHDHGNDEQWTPRDLLVDPTPSPEQAAVQSELHDLVVKLIAALPASQRAALGFRQRDDFSIRNAAEALGVPEGTVKARLARGRAKLIERFQKATGTAKAQSSACNAKEKRRALNSGARRKSDDRVGRLPVVAFGEQGG
jgi:RNA polymerase sigma-70 factor, ECF subfamily